MGKRLTNVTEPSKKQLGWQLFDAIVANAPLADRNPWADGDFKPDYDTLKRLLAVPVYLEANSQSGVPALALDVWVAYELRRAGFDADKVWPRATEPRVLPTEIAKVLENLDQHTRRTLEKKMASGLGGAVSASAHLLGKNYVKQVDVVMSAWHTGPELMISTKRMDSSFGKNAANRVEESYGDAKNLRLRHPQAALGFVYGLNAAAFDTERDRAVWLVDLLTKLGREDDAYDAVALIVPKWTVGGVLDDGVEEVDPLAVSESGDLASGTPDGGPDDAAEDTTAREVLASSRAPLADDLSQLPAIHLVHSFVPAELDPGRFFATMINRVLAASPVNFHAEARNRKARSKPYPGPT